MVTNTLARTRTPLFSEAHLKHFNMPKVYQNKKSTETYKMYQKVESIIYHCIKAVVPQLRKPPAVLCPVQDYTA